MISTIAETQTTVEHWTADRSRTTVEFEVRHLWGLHTVRGHFRRCDGSYVVGPAGSAIELTIDAASVDTGNAARESTSGQSTSSTSPSIHRCGSRRSTSPDWETDACT